jgi:hypothetical protein
MLMVVICIPDTLCTIYTYYVIHVSLALLVLLKYGIYVYRVLLCLTCPYPIAGNMVYLPFQVCELYTIYSICLIPKYMTKGFHPVYIYICTGSLTCIYSTSNWDYIQSIGRVHYGICSIYIYQGPNSYIV